MDQLLNTIQSPDQLRPLTLPQLEQLATEMRLALCELLAHRDGPLRVESRRGRTVPGAAS